ncbi:putative folate-biopterin transporter 2 [Panicum miliaceum]|uniref:Folate-biopterin transporter 2 n=1 Tax=Panicum miliaceum TaxID=4540 RepID=A0A3L6QBT2_PANMI|nr:putative folate-biopterin transporter 2 [Panicum miliaceum]
MADHDLLVLEQLSPLRRLSRELHWSFVLAVVAVYGACLGVGNAVGGVAAGYYWKDVQRVQPSAAQFYQGVTDAPWVVKPLWGLLTDVVPIAGYRRRPYFVLAGVVGVSSMLMLSLHRGLGIMPALLALTAQSAGAAIADVTVDALVHKKFYKAIQSMGTTLKCPEVWRPCVYMFVSHNLSLDIQGGMFYWYTDPVVGPGFSEGFISLIYAIGSVGSLLGVLLYQSALKDYPFRSILLWGQVLSSLAGMLDLVLVTRLNLKIGIPDYFFAMIDNSISQMVGRLKWLPLLVLCSKLCSPGIEGTFYTLLMSLQNAGLLMSAWWGGLLLHMLSVNRMEFSNLWIAVLIRNISRLVPLTLLFLVPQSDQKSTLLPADMLDGDTTDAVKAGSVEFSVLVQEDSGVSPNMVAMDDRTRIDPAG